MHFSQLVLASAAAKLATASGFATYREIRSGEDFDNSNQIRYSPLTRSDTLFLYIQIMEGVDDSDVIADFKTLAKNYGDQGIKAIPRVRYGNEDGDVTSEPKDLDVILNDIERWTEVFQDVIDRNVIEIPLIQAGFLGQWGEWHGGHFTPGKGVYETDDNIDAKQQVADALLKIGPRIALRYPQDHSVLGYENNTRVTIHNDCIFNEGPGGADGGTFPTEDIEGWSDYVKRTASGHMYGGEPCNQAAGSTYDWSDYADVCGDNGLIPYIHEFEISYLNPENPPQLGKLFKDEDWSDCIDRMGAALRSYS